MGIANDDRGLPTGNDRWSFRVGKPYGLKQAESADEWLDTALQAERYIEGFAIEDGDGIHWEGVGGEGPNPGYADGSAGIMHFYIQLARVTGDPKHRDIARRAAEWVRDHLAQAPVTTLEGFDSCYGLMLLEAAEAFGDPSYAQTARRFAQRYLSHCEQGEHGPYWTGNTAWVKDGGILLFLLALGRRLDDPEILGFVRRAGVQYLSEGGTGADGHVVFDGHFGGTATFEGVVFHMDHNMPNWEFGAAGSGYILLKLYELTGEGRYLDAARDQLRYLRSVAVPQTRGVLIPRSLAPEERDLFPLGHCHGIAGTGQFPYLLHRLTGDGDAMAFVHALADGFESVGAPEHQSRGLWNIDTLCCGHAGLVHYFVGLYLATGDRRWHDLAIRCGNVILGMKEDLGDGRADWPIAFWRQKPDDITRPHSLFRGAAGIGLALIEIAMMERGDFTLDRTIDDPFPTHWTA
ncbi:lanthionine synthetase LanC family protein [Bifidobacterium platyrrhinorum]|uniref:Lanthionine synthetase n=1 Tax=Bifidobacterium platyrrhinorum TaxID=2661628 RepID=A0A6L9STC5_9BIFI|nr:lanthionine synthetase LanC family protein [Bifidobacterium platyrrhinorum]NEG55810.1 hypothetical protein [Bifidobacterium platyrrhinorum]